MSALNRTDVRPVIQSKAGAGLVMTDIGFLVALGLAFYVAVDPLEWRLERIALTKHLPLLLALPFIFLTMAAGRIVNVKAKFPRVSPAFRPLLALALWIVAGSLYARFHSGIQNSFLFAGVYMLVAPVAAYMLIRSADPARMLRAYLGLLLLAWIVVFVGLAKNYGVRQVYHELEYLVPPVAVFFAFGAGRKWMRWAGVCVILITAFLFKKNTGYLVALLVFAYLMFFLVWPAWSRQDAFRKMIKTYALLIGLLAIAALAAYLLTERVSYLPSGNPKFRMLTYERAWGRFIASPLWGTAFTAPGTEKFTGFDTGVANNVLPTHSDILDILSNGGLLGVIFWLWGLIRVARLAYSTILRPSNLAHPLAPYGHMLACMSLAAVLTYAFNPIILQPAKSMLLWANLGFLVGISLLVKAEMLKTKDSKL